MITRDCKFWAWEGIEPGACGQKFGLLSPLRQVSADDRGVSVFSLGKISRGFDGSGVFCAKVDVRELYELHCLAVRTRADRGWNSSFRGHSKS